MGKALGSLRYRLRGQTRTKEAVDVHEGPELSLVLKGKWKDLVWVQTVGKALGSLRYRLRGQTRTKEAVDVHEGPELSLVLKGK